jgi:hypothetical protein
VDEDRNHDCDLRDVDDDEDHSEAEEAPDRRQIAHHPREQLTGFPAAMEEHRQALQLRVQLDPNVGLHSKRRLGHDPASEEHQQRLDNPEGDGRRAECVQAAPVGLGNGPVDHRPGDERDDDGRCDTQTGEDGHRDEPQRVRA